MSIKGLKTRLKKLEPKKLAEYFFGCIHVNDPHCFHTADHHFLGVWRVYGHIRGVCACFDSGNFDTFEQGLELLKKALRRHTLNVCNIFSLETIESVLDLKTIYSFEDTKLIDKYPQGLNEIPPNMTSGEKELNKMTDLEWVGFFNETV